MAFLYRWGWVFLLLLFSFTAFYGSGIDAGTSHDRLKYLSIAWSMYQHGDYFIPTMNGAPYTDKPPLLFWLIADSWKLFGVNMFGPQLIILISYIAWGLLIRAIYATIFENDELGKNLSPYILLGSFEVWQGTWFLRVDLLLITGVLLCNLGIIRLLTSSNLHSKKNKNFLSLFFISVGTCIGLYGKGPVIYIFTFLPFLASLLFMKNYRQFFLKITPAVLIGTLMMAATWAIPAAIMMGYDFAQQIFYMQIAHRAIRTEVPPYVKRSYFIYLYQYLPILFLPWIVNIVFFKKMKNAFLQTGVSGPFIAAIFIISLLILSCFGQKTAWYILPLLPFGVLIFTRFFVNNKQILSIIWFNRILFGSCFVILGVICIVLVVSPTFLHYAFKNFGEAFFLSPSFLYGIAALSFLTCGYLFFSKKIINTIVTASSLFFIIYSAINVYFVVYEKNFTHLNQVGEILRHQALNKRGIILYARGDTPEYLGQFNYVARLTSVISTITHVENLKTWLKEHPKGMVIYYGEQCPEPKNLQMIAGYYEKANKTPYLLCQQ